MTFVSKIARGVSFGALAAGLTLTAVSAQNGTNYHVLTNSFDVAYIGVGAGGTQTAADGWMTVIPGEELKGSHTVAFSGDFGYRNPQFREVMCVFNNPAPPAQLALRFDGLLFIEMDGLNGNTPVVFTNPACNGVAGPHFPLGTSGFIPYGTGPASSFSFLLTLLPTGAGLPSATVALLPDNGIINSAGGTATLIAAAQASLPIASTGFCWGVQFTWQPSALTSLDDVDSWVHYNVNSVDGNQYWGISNNEMNPWQSWTVGLDGGATGLIAFTANSDYGLLMATTETNTAVSAAPVGTQGGGLAGLYYTQTENVRNEFGAPSLNLNGGFDVGRSSRVISLSGTFGVPNPTTGLGNQNPGTSGLLPTLGLVSWDNGGDFNGSVRVPWVSVDFLGLGGGNPDTDPGVVKSFFGVRLPVVSFGLLQGVTNACFAFFGTVTSTAPSGWPDPDGFASGAFGVAPIAGASAQFPVIGLTTCNIVGSVPVNITYGTTGRKDGPGGLTFNPAIADLSSAKECFLVN